MEVLKLTTTPRTTPADVIFTHNPCPRATAGPAGPTGPADPALRGACSVLARRLAPRRRAGVEIGMLGVLLRLLQDHLRLRVVASCGPLLGQQFRTRGDVSRRSSVVIATGRRHRVGRGEEEVDLAALVELGVQGLLIEQLRGLGLDEHLHLAVIDEGITGDRLGDERELEPLVAGRDAQPSALGGLGRQGAEVAGRDAQPSALGGLGRQGADDVLGVIGQGKHGCSCSVGGPPDPPPSDGPRTMSNRAARPSACRGRRTIATRATLPWASWMPSTERSTTPKNTSLTVSKPLPLNRSKDRTGAFARSQAPGGDNKSPRALVNAATELAHSVKRRSHLHAKRLGAPGMVRSGRDLRHPVSYTHLTL